MSELGANAIRVYHVDPTGDHKGCMSAFEEKGIYVFVDLDDFDTQINQVGTSEFSSSWTNANETWLIGLSHMEQHPIDCFHSCPEGVFPVR
jgi:Glucanosyltransferase